MISIKAIRRFSGDYTLKMDRQKTSEMNTNAVTTCSTGYVSTAGDVLGELPAFTIDVSMLPSLYEAMVLTPAFDEKAVELQRTGRLGTYASALGREAVGVGVASAMRPDDVFIPAFQEQAAQLCCGVKIKELLLYERENGSTIIKQGP